MQYFKISHIIPIGDSIGTLQDADSQPGRHNIAMLEFAMTSEVRSEISRDRTALQILLLCTKNPQILQILPL